MMSANSAGPAGNANTVLGYQMQRQNDYHTELLGSADFVTIKIVNIFVLLRSSRCYVLVFRIFALFTLKKVYTACLPYIYVLPICLTIFSCLSYMKDTIALLSAVSQASWLHVIPIKLWKQIGQHLCELADDARLSTADETNILAN